MSDRVMTIVCFIAAVVCFLNAVRFGDIGWMAATLFAISAGGNYARLGWRDK